MCEGGRTFHRYERGFLAASCSVAGGGHGLDLSLFPADHLRDLFGSFAPSDLDSSTAGEAVEEVPTLVVTREKAEHVNVYHALTDLFNAYLALRITGLADGPRQVLFLDDHADGCERATSLFAPFPLPSSHGSDVCTLPLSLPPPLRAFLFVSRRAFPEGCVRGRSGRWADGLWAGAVAGGGAEAAAKPWASAGARGGAPLLRRLRHLSVSASQPLPLTIHVHCRFCVCAWAWAWACVGACECSLSR